MKISPALALISAFSALGLSVQAQISFTGNYSQNFDGMGIAANDTFVATPAGWTVGTAGNNAFQNLALSTLTSVASSDGVYTPNSGGSATPAGGNQGRYNIGGGATPSDRALGSRATSEGGAGRGQFIDVAFTNNTGATLTEFTLSYTGENWVTDGTPDNGVYALYFSTTGLANSWALMGSNFNYTAPVGPGYYNLVDGNLTANRQSISATFNQSGSLSIANGANFYVRFFDGNEANNDKLIAVDDFSITSPIPEPSTSAALAGALFLGFAALRRRRA
jgi:hypothetical protein